VRYENYSGAFKRVVHLSGSSSIWGTVNKAVLQTNDLILLLQSMTKLHDQQTNRCCCHHHSHSPSHLSTNLHATLRFGLFVGTGGGTNGLVSEVSRTHRISQRTTQQDMKLNNTPPFHRSSSVSLELDKQIEGKYFISESLI
jgi:hypothetical protein